MDNTEEQIKEWKTKAQKWDELEKEIRDKFWIGDQQSLEDNEYYEVGEITAIKLGLI